MPRGGDDIDDLEDLLLEDVGQEESELYIDVDKKTGIHSWIRESDGKLHNPEGAARIYPDRKREYYLDGLLESINGEPSVIYPDGTRQWHVAGLLQSIDGKPSAVYPDGTREWHVDGFLTYVGDLPSVIYPDGTRIWTVNGFLHREGDKPAMIKPDGTKIFFSDNVRHRDSGDPSVIYPDGSVEYYNRGTLHREGAPAIIYKNKKLQEENGGLERAYYLSGISRRTKTGEHEKDPCMIFAGKDARLSYFEGYEVMLGCCYYYEIYADGREALRKEDGFILQITDQEGNIIPPSWQTDGSSGDMHAERVARLFAQSREISRHAAEQNTQ